MPTAMPMTLKFVAISPDSTSVSLSSARIAGSAGATLVMYAPAARPAAKTAQTARQSVVKPRRTRSRVLLP
jgi:hypothetical protein